MEENQNANINYTTDQNARSQDLIGSVQAWYTPVNGGRSIFSFKKSNVYVYPGWIIVTDSSTNAEVARIQITSDIKFSDSYGWVKILHNNGQKISRFKRGTNFMFYSPWLGVSLPHMAMKNGEPQAKLLASFIRQAAIY